MAMRKPFLRNCSDHSHADGGVFSCAPAAALVAALSGSEPLLASWTQIFMRSAAGFFAQFFPLFLLGAVFGKLMEDNGRSRIGPCFCCAKVGNAPTRHVGQSLVAQISGNIEQLFNTMAPNRCNHPKFGEMASDRIDHRSLPANEQVWRVRWSVRQLCCSGLL